MSRRQSRQSHSRRSDASRTGSTGAGGDRSDCVAMQLHDGLARRQDDRSDGRGVLVTATAHGRRVSRRASEYRARLFSQTVEGLGGDHLAAINTLTVILDRLGRLLDHRAS